MVNNLLIEAAPIIKKGGIAVIPTDTIYGIVGSALNPETVEKIYKLRKRDLNKPFIILISDLSELKKFGVILPPKIKDKLKKSWPEKTTIIFPCHMKEFAYLHRKQNSLAFRLPNQQDLFNLLKETGPLVAPSANTQGDEPAVNIKQAKKYFGNSVDFYLDGKQISSHPSSLLKLEDGNLISIRR